MSFTIGLRFYRVSVRKKGDQEQMEMGPGGEPCDFLEYAEDFVRRRQEPTIETATSRTWFFEPIATNSIRVVHGYINYGTHGFESKFKDVKTRTERYRRKATDLEEIPLYFQVWSPSSSKTALIAFQSFQGRSCIDYVRSAMRDDYQERFPGYLLTFRVIAPGGAVFGEAPVKSITFLKPRNVSDQFDRLRGRSTDELDYEVTIRARKRGGIISRYKDIQSLFPASEAGVVEFDGRLYEGVKADVKIGRKRRVVGIFGSGTDAGLVDVSDEVKRDPSGHPIFDSIVSEVDTLMEEFYGSIKT